MTTGRETGTVPSAIADANTVAEVGRRLRAGEVSAVALVEAALARIAATEPALHAHVVVLAETALDEAARADQDLARGVDRGPLHGVPFGVKDIFDIAGVPTRCGSRVREDAPPAATDAPVVVRLRAAGAIPVAKSVTQEFAAGVVSAPARNPWDPARIPGGSSGGSAAGVAAGCYPVALGSDTGGSVRIPAATCGVVGLKPTYGLVPRTGVFPLSWALDTVGPLAATVADAAAAFDAMVGPDPGDATSRRSPGPPAVSALDGGVRGLRLGVPGGFFAERVAPDVLAAFGAALEVFRQLGAEVVSAPWPEAGPGRAAASIINRTETCAVHEATARDPARLARYGPDLRVRFAAVAQVPPTDYIKALRARVAVRNSAARLFAEHRLDAVLAPALPTTALRADDLLVRHDGGGTEPVGIAYTRLTQPFNATGQPVLGVPCGFDRLGLPVGLQIAGRPEAEATVCRIGAAFEAATAWHRRRPAIGRPAGAGRGEGGGGD